MPDVMTASTARLEQKTAARGSRQGLREGPDRGAGAGRRHGRVRRRPLHRRHGTLGLGNPPCCTAWPDNPTATPQPVPAALIPVATSVSHGVRCSASWRSSQVLTWSSVRCHSVFSEIRKAPGRMTAASRSHAVVLTVHGCGSGGGAPVGRRWRAVRGAAALPGGAPGAAVRSVFSLTARQAFLGSAGPGPVIPSSAPRVAGSSHHALADRRRPAIRRRAGPAPPPPRRRIAIITKRRDPCVVVARPVPGVEVRPLRTGAPARGIFATHPDDSFQPTAARTMITILETITRHLRNPPVP